jgi:hypothetical protein
LHVTTNADLAIAQQTSPLHFAMKTKVQSQYGQCSTYSGQPGNGADFSLKTLAIHCELSFKQYCILYHQGCYNTSISCCSCILTPYHNLGRETPNEYCIFLWQNSSIWEG